MNPPLLPREAERFRTVVMQRLGLAFEDEKLDFLGEVLRGRLEQLRRSAEAYLGALEREPSGGELEKLAQALTVGETYFFRNHDQFRAVAEVVFPERQSRRRHQKIIRLLSAGCASGEEAYSLAILARETIADPSWEVQIRAVDLNPAALEKAARARYSAWALRETPPDIRQRWFRPDGPEMIVHEQARATVKFEAKNLVADDPALWQPGAYDAIFFRNVMMYFAPEQMRAVIARIAASLAEDGYLFLGHAETLRGLSDAFHLRHTHGTFYYQRKGPAPAGAHPKDDRHAMVQAVPRSNASFPAPSETWVDTIREASARVAALLPARGPAKPSAGAPPSWDRALTLDLLRKERFSEALASLPGQPSGRGPDVLLLEAMLLAHSGELAAAEDSCRRLLLIDELNAGAHYALALCRDNAGDREAAAEYDRVAVYLDPTFAMPRLHLGLLARRQGAEDAARRDLGQALVLLKREDATRLLLFGGGFKREALIALCESALRDCGGRP